MPGRMPVILSSMSFATGLWLWASTLPAPAADISPLLTRAGAAAKGGDHAASIDALEQALEKVRSEAPLALKPFLAVNRPAKYFGDFAPRGNTEFRRGEALQFYLEPKNLVYPRSASDMYEPAFEVDLEVLSSTGEAIAKQPRFGAFRLPTKSPVHDLFMNLTVTLTGVPAGQYSIRFIVRDLNSKKSATVTQPITVK